MLGQHYFGVGIMELDVHRGLQRSILRGVLVSNFFDIRLLYGGIHYRQAYSVMLLFFVVAFLNVYWT